jgi:hypothetical protein
MFSGDAFSSRESTAVFSQEINKREDSITTAMRYFRMGF